MLTARVLLVSALLVFSGAASAQRASDESIRRLFKITEVEKILDATMTQIDQMMRAGVDHALGGRPPSPRERELLDRMQTRTVQIFREEMTWQKLEPVYLRIYGDSFTQQEVDGMLAFYATPSGQAVIRKMPLVLNNTMREMQAMMGPMMQKFQAVQEEMMRDLQRQKH